MLNSNSKYDKLAKHPLFNNGLWASMRFPDFGAIARLVSPTARRREKFRKLWGCVGDGDGWLSTTLFDLRRNENPCAVDDKTWRDLELGAFFQQLDAYTFDGKAF